MRKLAVAVTALFALAACSVDNDNDTLRNSEQVFKFIEAGRVADGLTDWDDLLFIDVNTDKPYHWVGFVDKETLIYLQAGACYTRPMDSRQSEEVDCPNG